MDKFNRLKEIIETYNKFEQVMKDKGIEFGETYGGGFWAPTNFKYAIIFLEFATNQGIFQSGKPIVDAGSGDKRMSTLFDVYGFKPIINIELDKRFDFSQEVIDDLINRNIVNGNNIHNVHGDFTTSQTYKQAGIPFREIPYFYMGINSEPLKKLAKKIKEESPKQTKLIVYGMFDKGQEPELPLQLEKRISVGPLADFLVYKR